MKVSLFALAAVFAAAPVFAGNVTISNDSDWELHEFYVSAVGENEWGEDQLGDDVIGTGETFTLSNVPCDTYDIRLVDEDGDECVVADADICGKGGGWHVTSEDLLSCQAATE